MNEELIAELRNPVMVLRTANCMANASFALVHMRRYADALEAADKRIAELEARIEELLSEAHHHRTDP